MRRREFNKLACLAALGTLTENPEASPAQAASNAREIVLEDDELLVAFDTVSGALTRLERKATHWPIQRRPELGLSFRLLVPLPNQRANFVLGSRQHARSVEKISANQVRLEWDDLMSEHGGVLPITFTATVTLDRGALTFESTLDNRSSLMVETVDYPCLGDFNPPAQGIGMEALNMWIGAIQSQEIYPHFSNNLGYWGVRYPTKTIGTNQSQFCLIQSPEQGLYLAMHDPDIRYLLQFTFEQHPGTVDWNANAVPSGDEISGIPAYLEVRNCHFIFAHPRSLVNLAPVVLRPYTGDWHAGLDVYKEWRATWFTAPRIPAWARDVHSWLQLQVDGAEQDYTISYRRLVQYGLECAEHGVGALQLVGWSLGGQDGGDPSLSTDPGLGTWQELHDAIAQIQAKGVKMILFGKPHLADMSTAWYKDVLHQYDAIDPYGNKYESDCCSYSTPTQLAGINNHRRTSMDVCSREYRDLATREFEKILALGASGWLFDEVLWHEGVIYNFSPDHGYEPPGYLYGGDIPLVKQFRAAADKTNPDFLFAGEGPVDWLMPWYPLGYYRINATLRAAQRYLDSQTPLMAAVRGVDAREDLNLMLLYRYIISYEPYNFKGHVTDFPLTLAYGKKIDALRRRYREWLWDGEFRDTLDATVEADGAHLYTVFRSAAGTRAVVVVNEELDRAITAQVFLPHARGRVLATPEQPDARPAPGVLTIPARSAIVVMEQ